VNAPSLFPDAELTKQERAAALDQQIAELISGKSGGPYGLFMPPEAAAVLRAIRFHRGADNAIPIRELRSRLKLSDRDIKAIVRKLRISFHLPIGSSKDATEGGYFLILTAEDQAVFDRSFLDQVRAQIQAHRCVAGPQRTSELLGQLQLEVQR
jgi:hypothetical protein